MFEALTEKLGAVFKRLNSKGRLTEKEIDEALREVRLALLEADVHFKVVRDFLAKVRVRSLNAQVLESLTPAQQIIKIVKEELIAILGGGNRKLESSELSPTVVMLVGLQGSGKTTTAAKLALHLRRSGQKALLVASDLQRPAAVEQLATLGKQLNIPVYQENPPSSAVGVARNALAHAKEIGARWVMVDTAGRLHIDDALMEELAVMKSALDPSEVLLVVDAMTGQDAIRIGEEFHAKVGITGLILTKMDGDARGGAALSITSVTSVPVKFIGIGEKPEALEPFYPDRLASRILGMGDVLTLIEKAQTVFDQDKAKELERKMRRATFDLEDFLQQLQQVRKMGPLSQVLEMIPGFSRVRNQINQEAMEEKHLKKIEAIIYSMTPKERHNPDILDGSRRRRIAKGSGTKPEDVSQLVNQFRQAQKVMKQLAGMRPGSPFR